MTNVTIFDTTLRDGEQAKGISLTVEDKVKIAKLLDNLGVHYIEGGWPSSNPKAVEFFKQMKEIGLKNAKLVAFGSTRRAKNSAKDDTSLNAIISTGVPATAIFGKTWDFHVTDALGIPLEENLDLIYDSVKYLKENGLEVFFDAEHFFDGYKRNSEYSLKCLKKAEEAGVDMLVLCDTNGGTLPHEIEKIIKEITPLLKAPLGIHAHNDSGMGVANSVVAVACGATQVQGTINGYGERCGNANLCSIIPNLKIKMKIDCITSEQLAALSKVSHHVAEIANMAPDDQQPFVGKNAFAHKAGIHVSAILKNSKTYEHIEPELVGNKQDVTVSELSGISNLVYKAKEFGIELDKADPRIKEIINTIKIMENKGYAFEEGEASFELLMRRTLGLYERFFTLEGFRVTNEKRGHEEKVLVESTIKVNVDNNIYHTAAEGNGPISALDNALRKALAPKFPAINEIHLTDYKVRVMDGKEGTYSSVRVLIESTDGDEVWGTVGVSENVVEASWNALIDSIEYKLLKEKRNGK